MNAIDANHRMRQLTKERDWANSTLEKHTSSCVECDMRPFHEILDGDCVEGRRLASIYDNRSLAVRRGY